MKKKYEVVHVLTVVDGQTDELVDLVELDAFKVESFRDQFDVDTKADPEMFNRYSVGPDDVPFLERELDMKLQLNFQRFAYFIEAAKKDL